ncbi:DNA polymerase III subunit beta [Candidatus Falkowbacteria bacterium]|jgi:DNA polymerase-3 subunit beta|nr:DNA polymerase III subunit beta [Candidatus Falkowbacteria bacterium]
MRFISLQENLKKGLNIVGHVSSKNINLPILNNILIKAENGNIELVSTNLEIGITYQVRGKIEVEGQFTVDSKLISEYVNLLSSGEKVKIEEKDNELKVECGNYKTKIKGEVAKEFPLIPTLPKQGYYSCKSSELKKALNSVSFAVSNNENRVELSGVLFAFEDNKLSLVATDSYRLAEKEIKINSQGMEGEQKVIVPGKTVQELMRVLNNLEAGELINDLELKFYLSENQILFVVDSVELISRLINGHYPDYQQIIPVKSQTNVLVEKSEIIRAVKAAALFSKTGINDVTLLFLKNKIMVSAFSGASGESQIELEAGISGDDNEITINYRYLLDGLNNIEGEMIKLDIVNNSTPCVLKSEKGDDYIYIVMPIRQ